MILPKPAFPQTHLILEDILSGWLDYLSYAAVDFGAVDCKFGHLGVDASGETVCTYFYCLFSLEIAQLEYCIMRHRGCYSAHAVQVQR